ncbi:hypothetical protein H0H81_005806 [Sphagnurus paluster]|uniref:Uncharacterized protein n=2 Tax=Sphagnurus paluster TaxID=117069 RepID=A0A9P7KG33_9AGAR|nr:hypothetical protein H0H81_005806 [Sphagnurus paluster]
MADNYFEEIPNSSGRVWCTACSSQNDGRRPTELDKNSISTHRGTKKHKAALQAINESHTGAAPLQLAESIESTVPGILSLASRYVDLESEEDVMTPARPDLFENITVHGGEYYGDTGNQILFSAGEIPKHENVHEKLWREIDALEFGHMAFATEDSTIPDIIASMQTLGLDETDDEEGLNEMPSSASTIEDARWAPHGSKTMFMLDLLDNLPRLRLSDDHIKAIIWAMRECGTPGVPSFYALRKKQAALTKEVGIKTQQHTSPLGNQFYLNHPVDLIALVSKLFNLK